MLQHVTYVKLYFKLYSVNILFLTLVYQLGIFVPRKLAIEHMIDVHLLRRSEETRNYLVLEPLNWLHMLFGACRSFCTREMASNFFFCLKTGFKLFKRKKRVFFPQDSSMHKLVISLLSETNNLGKCIVLQRGLYVNTSICF